MFPRLGSSARLLASRAITSSAVRSQQAHTLPPLPYASDALAPIINKDIMELHHTKHHQTYVNNLNAAEEKLADAHEKGDVVGMIGLQSALKFNGGGHINHCIFWEILSPDGGGVPTGDLAEAITRDFGSFDRMKDKLSAASVAIQGSGWGWLGYSKTIGSLTIATCANQDPLEPTTGLVPLFGIDVWEHAYYLQYKNVRPDYVKQIWNVANWENVAQRYRDALSNNPA